MLLGRILWNDQSKRKSTSDLQLGVGGYKGKGRGPLGPRRGVKLQLYSFFNLGAKWVWVVIDPFTAGKGNRYRGEKKSGK